MGNGILFFFKYRATSILDVSFALHKGGFKCLKALAKMLLQIIFYKQNNLSERFSWKSTWIWSFTRAALTSHAWILQKNFLCFNGRRSSDCLYKELTWSISLICLNLISDLEIVQNMKYNIILHHNVYFFKMFQNPKTVFFFLCQILGTLCSKVPLVNISKCIN